jgi:hypothetical protein
MAFTDKQIIIGCCILLVLIILIKKLYDDNKNTKTIEGFEDALDLLNKYKSTDVQVSSDGKSSDIELSINPWTTKLHNLQSEQKVKPIGLYKPHLVINGEKYSKLGDMISLNTDYSPPNKNEFTLLIKRVGSDIKEPMNYNLVVNFGNPNIPSYYYQFDTFINSQTNLSLITANLNNCMSALVNLRQIILNNQDIIRTTIKNVIASTVNLQIGNSNPISLYSIMNMTASTIGGLIQTPISATTLVTLPLGISGNITTPDNQFSLDWPTNIDINKKIIVNNMLLNISPNSIFRNFTSDNIVINISPSIKIFNVIDPKIIITYLQNLCNDILTIFTKTNINPEFIKYSKLADSVDGVNTVLTVLNNLQQSQSETQENSQTLLPDNSSTPTTIMPPTASSTDNSSVIAFNDTLRAYADKNRNTLLGGILNILFNKSYTYYYPCLKFTPSQLAYNSTSNSVVSVINGIKNANGIIINNFSSVLLDNAKFLIDSNASEIIELSTKVMPNLSKMVEFQTMLNDGKIDYFPLQIYEPIAPPDYVALGHVFCNTIKDFYKLSTTNYACVPKQCVKEIREWLSSDKVFEYNQDRVYWALFKNPYTGTFISVNQPQMPAGKVCKVVACVAKCNAIDELQKADDCARKYYQMNKNITANIKQTPDLVASAEEEIYLEKIKEKSDNIARLKQRAQQMQISIDKADIVNEELNKSKLQNYVDTQKRNIDLVVTQLEKDNNKIKTNVNIPVDAINKLIDIINNIEMLNSQQKEALKNKIIDNATQLSNNIITSSQYNANLNNIARSCPQYDLTGLVKKSLVSDVCYGCGTP